MRHNFFKQMLLVCGLVFTFATHAQDYPVKPIKIIVPNAPGGGSDRMARLIADHMRGKWGQIVTVENRGGGGGNIGAEIVAKSAPDGYTLLFTPQFPLVINKSLYSKLNYDPDTFVPISLAAAGDIALLVHPKIPVTSVEGLIAFAKSHPDRLNYSSAGAGSMGHLLGEVFRSTTGVQISHVPYKGNTPALTDLLGGQVEMMFLDFGSALPHIRTGKVRAIAVTGEKRNPSLPDVPTVATVLPEFIFSSWFGMVAPAGTPPLIANKLSLAVAEALKNPDVGPIVQKLSVEVIASTPAEMAQVMKRDRERWSKIVRASGATAQ
jgi:tripartite-type tricarboxylate transporter receptor subunit TctC